MTQGTVGWLCPKCGAVISPYQAACTACVPIVKSGFGTLLMGSITGSVPSFSYTFGGSFLSGTIFASPKPTIRPEHERAREVVSKWEESGGSAKALIIAAVDELINDTYGDDD